VGLSYDEIAEILKLIDSSSCDELIVEDGDTKLVVRRNSAGRAYSPSHEVEIPAPATTAQAVRQPAVTPAPEYSKSSNQIEVTAPMVGTFYRAPSPDALVFVDVSSVVRKGDPLCLIEVMKLFTTITSEHDGRVVAIGAANGELVEYGRALFVLDPA
jgi:acetyl-CoA carboxylase biotin carboxyl carrier protein